MPLLQQWQSHFPSENKEALLWQSDNEFDFSVTERA